MLRGRDTQVRISNYRCEAPGSWVSWFHGMLVKHWCRLFRFKAGAPVLKPYLAEPNQAPSTQNLTPGTEGGDALVADMAAPSEATWTSGPVQGVKWKITWEMV